MGKMRQNIFGDPLVLMILGIIFAYNLEAILNGYIQRWLCGGPDFRCESGLKFWYSVPQFLD